MQISIDQSEGLERIVNIAIESDDIKSKVDAKLSELGKEVRIKGFRQGRVPKNILNQRFGKHVRQEVLSEIMQSSIEQAIKENEFEIVSTPEITNTEDTKDGGFEFKAKIELMPEIPAIDFTAIKVDKHFVEVSDKDVDGMISNLQKQKQDWKDSKGKITNSDLVTIDYSAKTAEFTYPEENTEKMGILLGESQIPASLKKAIIGLKVKETAEVKVDFPKPFNVEKLAGLKATVNFTVTDVKKPKLPELDDEFVKSFGIESGDVAEFKKDIRANMERELNQAIKNRFNSNVLEQISKSCGDVTVPESMIRRESENMAQQEQQRAQQMGMNDTALPNLDQYKDEARKRIIVSLMIKDIANQQDIKTDFAKVRERINEISQTFEQPQEIVQMYYKNPELMANVEHNVIEEQVMVWIESQVSVNNKKMSFDDIMKPKS
ncbi:MAG: trigger factor [Proteobacteria bacterium]|nr:trigger factor [Pseudomonadota bacterium]